MSRLLDSIGVDEKGTAKRDLQGPSFIPVFKAIPLDKNPDTYMLVFTMLSKMLNLQS